MVDGCTGEVGRFLASFLLLKGSINRVSGATEKVTRYLVWCSCQVAHMTDPLACELLQP